LLPARLKSQLLEDRLLTEAQFSEVQEEHKSSGKRVVEILLEKQLVDEDSLIESFAKHYALPVMDLSNVNFDEQLQKILPGSLCVKHSLIPIGQRGETLVVAVSDPTNVQAIDDIRFETRLKVKLVLGRPSTIKQINERFHGMEMADLNTAFEGEEYQVDESAEIEESGNIDENDAPIIKFVTGLLVEAIKTGVSDIHIEPYEKELRVRYRLDGDLFEASRPPKNIKNALIARIKVLAKLRLDEKRLPQDGRVRMKISESRAVDFRVNTLPTIYGEKVVMRILDKSNALFTLDQLGFEPDDRERFVDAISQPWGMGLVTGATGSGKTTTLYAALNMLNTVDVNISTIEDPVEYNFSGINQCQTKEHIGLTFAEALRALLRQDPDIILLGEIRDTETAETALRAALTGHMVLSTLHTNNAPSTIMRLKDMNIEPFLINSAVRVVVAQRLVRKICEKCKTDDTRVDEKTLVRLGFPEKVIGKFTPKKGAGCTHCRKTGFKGRMAVHEVMSMTDKIREVIGAGGNTDEIRAIAVKEGMRTLQMNCMRKVIRGETTLEDLKLMGD